MKFSKMILKITKTRLLPRLCSNPRRFVHTGNNSSGQDVPDPVEVVQKEPIYETHIETSRLQKAILAAGSSLMALSDPWRDDMVAVSGEVTGHTALVNIHKKMLRSKEGRDILRDKPVINTTTVDWDYLKNLPPNTFGHNYVKFSEIQNITPDSRSPVQFVDDPELAFVMRRYRETHDLTHALLGMKTDLVGEAVVKWVEAIQTGLPMCIGAGIFSPSVTFKKESQFKRFRKYRPWAIAVGQEAKFLMNVYYEKRWDQDVDDLRSELRIPPLPI